MAKIYTGFGDGGLTQVKDFNGKVQATSKSYVIFDVIGDIDELNSLIGCILEDYDLDTDTYVYLEKVQHLLMNIGSNIANFGAPKIGVAEVEEIEKEIDKYSEKCPELKEFILPRNRFHLARAVCRRAERSLVKMKGLGKHESSTFMNRLSDLLFVLGRYIDKADGYDDIKWNKDLVKTDSQSSKDSPSSTKVQWST